MPRPKLLYLHGLGAVGGGFKAHWLVEQGFTVDKPALDDHDFAVALEAAQACLHRSPPDCIIGSSRGGAVAMNLERGQIPLVLLAPAWMRWGEARVVAPPVAILHSPHDELIPWEYSRQLCRQSGLPEAILELVGQAHGLTDPPALEALVNAIERLVAAGAGQGLGGNERQGAQTPRRQAD